MNESRTWTDWHRLNELDFLTVPSLPGAYMVSTDRPIARAIGVDDDGILHIGESHNLRKRLRSFLRCVSRCGEEGHMAGWRYAHFRLNRHFPLSTLRVKWRAAATKQDVYVIEGELLRSYLDRHCELPPLNYKFNWSRKEPTDGT